MKRLRTGLALAIIQVTLCTILLNIGRQQLPKTIHDFPVFVGPAIEISEAINAPVVLLELCVVGLFHRAGFGVGSGVTWNALYLVGVFTLWFLVGLKVEWVSRKGTTIQMPRRIVLDCLVLAIGIGLIFLAKASLQRDEGILMWGSALWALTLMGVTGWELANVAKSRWQSHLRFS
jgi:hypothetical protein